MKITFNESEKTFSVHLEAENMQEAAFLVRIGMNSTKEPILFESNAHKDGTFSHNLIMKKHPRSTSSVVKRK